VVEQRSPSRAPGRLALVALLVALVALGGAVPAAGAVDRPRPALPLLAGIDAVVGEEIAAGRIPGAVVLVGHEGRTVYARAFGDRSVTPRRQPMTEDTVFDLASLTKVVATATAVMQLVEAGTLDLDAPAARYWPAFADHGKERITIRELLTHRSGLRPDLETRGHWSGYGAALARLAAERPVAAPGTRFIYSDVNFAVLGELVHRASGSPLDAYCAAHVFAPLKMRATAFRPPRAWQERIAPTTYVEGRLLQGLVHDPTARRMGGIAGHAGLFSSARDLATFAQMMLDGGRAGDARILAPSTVVAMTTPQDPAEPEQRRGLGWDLASPGDPEWRAHFSARAYGHTGYTGTSLWIDPATRTYVIVLTNRVHPDGTGDVRALRARLAALVARALEPDRTLAPTDDAPPAADRRTPSAPAGRVATGLDVLAADGFAPLAGRRVGLVTNHTGRDAAGRRTIDLLRAAPRVTLAAIFTPEHGLAGSADGAVASSWEPTAGVPVYSLYGERTRPSADMLAGVDALVFDIQDAGVRFYTYVTTLAYAMEAAAQARMPFYVLDRPNPIDASTVQGPMLDDDRRSFTGYFPLPVRYGMTIGELARLFNDANRIGAELHVVSMRGYERERWYDQTGLPWVPPSPNLRSLDEATLYPGVALVEGANVSVGRGTASPFEVVGAPWIDGPRLAAYLNARDVAGVGFEPTTFTPRSDIYRGERCRGVRLVLRDRERLDAPALGVEIAAALRHLHRRAFRLEATLGMIGARWVVQAIARGDDPRTIVERWHPALARFAALREKFLLY
jgi:uncharacterized protein YbbC (DUF1343 family)/CubicO group peptidase (beta-lactamase class C family)